MVQNPAIPQTLNRYSYCLNNPLKYTDPSGNTVNIGGFDFDPITGMPVAGAEALEGLNEDTLRQIVLAGYAWAILYSAAPELVETLIESDWLITIDFADLPNALGSCAGDFTEPNHVTIELDQILTEDYSLLALTTVMGHECFHSGWQALYHQETGADWIFGNSIANEVFAFSFSYTVSQKIGGGMFALSYLLSDYMPIWNSDAQLNTLTNDLNNAMKQGGNAYNFLACCYPVAHMNRWQRGIEPVSFLIYANQIWVH